MVQARGALLALMDHVILDIPFKTQDRASDLLRVASMLNIRQVLIQMTMRLESKKKPHFLRIARKVVTPKLIMNVALCYHILNSTNLVPSLVKETTALSANQSGRLLMLICLELLLSRDSQSLKMMMSLV